MKRTIIALAGLAAFLASAATASAAQIEIGRTKAVATPACTGEQNDGCVVITRNTGIQYQVGKVKNPMLVPRAGKIVALTVQLGNPTPAQVDYFSKKTYTVDGKSLPGLGLGEPAVRVTTLRAKSRVRNNYHFVVTGQSEDFQVRSFLGSAPQFFLNKALPVRKGDLIALTIPTWAPALATNLETETNWRASRGIPCKNAANSIPQQFAQLRLGAETQYFCNYRTARLTYTATLGVNPTPTVKPTTGTTGPSGPSGAQKKTTTRR
jgi:hypothetical protein